MDINSTEFQDKIKTVAPLIKKKIGERSLVMIGYVKDKNTPNHFKMIAMNPDNTFDDIDYVLNEIEECAI